MRNHKRHSLIVLISNAILLHSISLPAAMVSSKSPASYNSDSSVAARRRTNNLYQQGAISFEQFDTLSAELAHPVASDAQVAQGLISSPLPPVTIPTAPSTSRHIPSPASAASSDSSNSTDSAVELSEFVYQRILTDLHITIKDEGYALTDAEKADIIHFFDQLPIAQLQGLQEIDILQGSPDKSQLPQLSGNTLKIYAIHMPEISKPQTPSRGPLKLIATSGMNLTSAIHFGIGTYVFEKVMTNAQRQDWSSVDQNSGAPEADFTAYYSAYFSASQDQLTVATNNATAALAGQWAISQKMNPSQAVANVNPQGLLGYLTVASLFTTSNQKARFYDEKGQMQYVSAYRDSQWLTIGNGHYLLEGNSIVGYTTENIYPTIVPGELAKLIATARWDPPVTIPASVLNAVPLK